MTPSHLRIQDLNLLDSVKLRILLRISPFFNLKLAFKIKQLFVKGNVD
jgi:hypothetical protein